MVQRCFFFFFPTEKIIVGWLIVLRTKIQWVCEKCELLKKRVYSQLVPGIGNKTAGGDPTTSQNSVTCQGNENLMQTPHHRLYTDGQC